jgi:hypothetical protein
MAHHGKRPPDRWQGSLNQKDMGGVSNGDAPGDSRVVRCTLLITVNFDCAILTTTFFCVLNEIGFSIAGRALGAAVVVGVNVGTGGAGGRLRVRVRA